MVIGGKPSLLSPSTFPHPTFFPRVSLTPPSAHRDGKPRGAGSGGAGLPDALPA